MPEPLEFIVHQGRPGPGYGKMDHGVRNPLSVDVPRGDLPDGSRERLCPGSTYRCSTDGGWMRRGATWRQPSPRSTAGSEPWSDRRPVRSTTAGSASTEWGAGARGRPMLRNIHASVDIVLLRSEPSPMARRSGGIRATRATCSASNISCGLTRLAYSASGHARAVRWRLRRASVSLRRARQS
jgi:hypothetical protein